MLSIATVSRAGTIGVRACMLTPASALASRRAFSTGSPRLAQAKASSPEGHGNARKLHAGRVAADNASTSTSALANPGADSTLPTKPKIHGDWVLFHPVYTREELESVEVLQRQAKTFSDKFAISLVKLARWGFDFVSGYKHKPMPEKHTMTLEELRKGNYTMDADQWLNRILFLETIAGVPGMVAATVRHLTSLRLMKRDSGWIHTLLEEAENERMHLMTFMTLRKSSLIYRLFILGAQGVYYNLFFISYILSPKICHRFVGHLEEEAVLTYTRCIAEIEQGRLPEWANKPAPPIAIDYWRLAANATLLDVIYAVRSDESTHRFVNHSLANLNPKTDVNPFALREPDMLVKGRKIEFERDEAEKYVEESREILQQGPPKP